MPALDPSMDAKPGEPECVRQGLAEARLSIIEEIRAVADHAGAAALDQVHRHRLPKDVAQVEELKLERSLGGTPHARLGAKPDRSVLVEGQLEEFLRNRAAERYMIRAGELPGPLVQPGLAEWLATVSRLGRGSSLRRGQ
jgi:hypothetical protein